jgi:hypothetical protein
VWSDYCLVVRGVVRLLPGGQGCGQITAWWSGVCSDYCLVVRGVVRLLPGGQGCGDSESHMVRHSESDMVRHSENESISPSLFIIHTSKTIQT